MLHRFPTVRWLFKKYGLFHLSDHFRTVESLITLVTQAIVNSRLKVERNVLSFLYFPG